MKSRRRLALALLLSVALTSAIATPVDYGLAKLGAATGVAIKQLPVRVVSNDPGLGPDGFTLACVGDQWLVTGGNERGAMYGLLDLAEQVRQGTALARIEPKTERARFEFRTIKFNLPFAAYRTSPTIEQHQDTCRDIKYWEAFLDMMASNRFNTLTLWSNHPFHYFVVPKSFPEAQNFSDAEMAEWRKLWTQLFALAKERGIETYLVNWNTFVSPEFSRAHNLGDYNITGAHIGVGTREKIVVDYTRECVQQTIDEYPDLTGFGITLGERMGDQTPAERRQFLDDTFFAGIAAAKRPVKFIYRAPLSANTGSGGSTSEENDRLTRAQIEGLRNNPNIILPVYTEFKYNWSHGHSTPNLFIVHGGKLSDAYWNPAPTSHRVVWTVRNEDFFVLRWGAPDFIREFIANNGAPHVGGVLVGSECYIPAKDYITNTGRHKTWTWAFERQWLWYALWGRLLHNPATPDQTFERLLGARFGPEHGPDLLKAWTLASRAQLRFAAFHRGTWDGSLYTEGFTGWLDNSHDSSFQFFNIENIITHPVLDTKYVNIADFVKAGGQIPADKVSPLQLAAELERDMTEARRLAAAVRERGNVSAPLAGEMADIDAWTAHGLYFAAKLRGGVALATYRQNGDKSEQAAAVAHLERALEHWRDLTVAGTKYNVPRMPHNPNELFSWARFIPSVERDIAIARGTATVDTPPRSMRVAEPIKPATP
ncbi:MAG: hypothetical protein PSV13_08020 [Lacunisphaera sp.]|nr:hypothetical protein [Lacunisphaera sp.]